MGNLVDAKNFDIEKFAESLAKAGREGVKWERRKLEWIRQEKAETKVEAEAA